MANSHPIAPPPTTTAELGSVSSMSTSSEVSTYLPSTSKPGSVRGTEPAHSNDVGALQFDAVGFAAADAHDAVGVEATRADVGGDLALLHEALQALPQPVDDLLLASLARGELDGRLIA